MALDKYWEHFKKTMDSGHLPQQIFYLDEMCLKFKHEMEVDMAQYKKVYKNTQNKTKQSIASLFMNSSLSIWTMVQLCAA